MPALETLPGLRIVASPEALDAAPWSAGTVVLRFAPDDAFAIGATAVDIADEHAIVAEESGFVGRWLTREELDDRLVTHIEWPLPTDLLALAQGLIAGVPAKLWLTTDRVLLVCAAAYAAELADRLG